MEKGSDIIGDLFCNRNLQEKEFVFWACGGVTASLWYDAVIKAGYTSKYKVDKYKAGKIFCEEILIAPNDFFAEIDDRNAFSYVIFTVEPHRLVQIKKELIRYGVDEENIFSCSYVHYYAHKAEILQLYDRLDDDESKRHLISFLRCRMFGELIPESSLIRGLTYFSVFEFQKLDRNEIYVDAGAFTGDTMEKFLFEKFGSFKMYYAFEPYKSSFRALNNRIERLKREWGISEDKVVTENMALGKENGVVIMDDALDAVGAVAESGHEDVHLRNCTRMVKLDDYFKDTNYSTLKADIEGKEMDMLRGGEESIKKYGVKLAISIYHRPEDILDIPKLILDMNHNYRLKLRCHIPDGSDTILYAFI